MVVTIINNKPGIQLEGFPFTTEISELVYNDLVNSQNRYITIDNNSKTITLKRSFFKKNKQVQNVTRFFVQLVDEAVNIEFPSKKNPLVFNSSYEDEIIDPNDKNKTISIILEAPHIDEYEKNIEKLTPIGAAQGIVGKKIGKNMDSFILTLKEFGVIEENQIYRVNLINAVNYQTSLHFIHEKPMNNPYRELRDKIWIKMWTEIPQTRMDFTKLIENLKKGSIIVNACPKSLKPLINQQLIPFAERIHLFESNHPTSTELWTKSLFKLN